MTLGDHLKTLEIRDKGTHIPALAILMRSDVLREQDCLARAGYGPLTECVLLVYLTAGEAKYDPYDWTGSRTMQVAHEWIRGHWDELESGSVVDVEFILGETTAPKEPEGGF